MGCPRGCTKTNEDEFEQEHEILFLREALRALMDNAPGETGKSIPLKVEGIPDEIAQKLARREMSLFGQRAAKFV